MPNFRYTALDQNGAEKTGFITADNKIAAMEMVRCLHGLSPDDLYRMASRVLLAESGQGREKGGEV